MYVYMYVCIRPGVFTVLESLFAISRVFLAQKRNIERKIDEFHKYIHTLKYLHIVFHYLVLSRRLVLLHMYVCMHVLSSVFMYVSIYLVYVCIYSVFMYVCMYVGVLPRCSRAVWWRGRCSRTPATHWWTCAHRSNAPYALLNAL